MTTTKIHGIFRLMRSYLTYVQRIEVPDFGNYLIKGSKRLDRNTVYMQSVTGYDYWYCRNRTYRPFCDKVT